MTMDSEASGAEAYDKLYVGPTCYIQTAENRFGRDVLEDLKTFVLETPHVNDMGFDDEDDDEEDEEEDEDDGIGEALLFLEPFEWDFALNNNGVETDPNHAQHGFPRIATTRHNLTALSQQYNLYFAAYQDRIYVYQPRRAGPQILPPPSLILHPRPSKLAQERGGVLDRHFPHQVNHLIVGNLGALEIVLLAYDDGDVVAYYTKTIARWINGISDKARNPMASPSRHSAHPKPFFHENVGKSAWGLAVHEQSRLIAVGSNLFEVTVFAFALSSTKPASKFPEPDDFSPILECGQTALQLQRHFQSRTRTWRIVLPLSRSAHNVPSLAFIDDEAGEADKVVATDVVGNVWLIDIWKIGALPVRWPDPTTREQQIIQAYRGWGVLVLPYSNFKPTNTIRESLGLPGGEVIAVTKAEENRVWLDTTCSLYYIKGFSSNPETIFRQRRTRVDYLRTHAAKAQCQEDDLSDAWDSSSDSEDDEASHTALPAETVGKKSVFPATADQEDDQWLSITRFSGKWDRSLDDISSETQLARFIIPTFGETKPDRSDTQQALYNLSNNRLHRTKYTEFSKISLPSHLAKGYCLLRTSTTDVELQPFDNDAACVECKYLLTSTTIPNPGNETPWDLHPVYAERISMLLHVPELNLVVAGSPTGRVALITLTKTAKRLHLTRVRYGFRVECVLPRRAEDEKKLRPTCTLIGVAIGPAPSRAGRGLELRTERGERSTGPRAYRLMLHYKDHTILMYDVARTAGKEELLVF